MSTMTKITSDAARGKPYTGERDNTDHRRLNSRKANRANNTKPPRTRDGAKHPGGKTMRRVLSFLSARRAGGTPTAGSMQP